MFGVRGDAETETEAAPAVRRRPVNSTVLLIDDDTDFLEITAGLLRDAGYTVLTSNSGAKGLNMIRYAQRELRLVVLDYNMPQLDGEQTLTHLRRLNPRTKVVGVTGLAPEELPAGYRENLDALIYKPLRREELLASLERVLQPAGQPATEATPA